LPFYLRACRLPFFAVESLEGSFVAVCKSALAGNPFAFSEKAIGFEETRIRGSVMTNREGIRVWVQRFKGGGKVLLQWIDPETGKRRSKSPGTSDPDGIEKARICLKHDLDSGHFEDKARLSWKRFREMYESERLTETGEKNREKAFEAFGRFERLVSPKSMGQISERTIKAFSRRMREEGLAPASVAAYLRYIKAALRWAEKQRLISRAPFVEMPKVPKNVSAAKIRKAGRITVEEFERIFAACPNQGWRLLVSFAWHCGLRREEARSVRGEHVHLSEHLLELPKNKANDSNGAAFITPELDELLRQCFPDGFPEGRLIPARDVPTNPSRISEVFGAIARRAAVKGSSKAGFVALHDLRRNFGSRWAGRVPAQVLQRLMRHSHIKTTLDFYADTERAAINAIWSNT
jgi:integrase